jgi:hypothetical protein
MTQLNVSQPSRLACIVTLKGVAAPNILSAAGVLCVDRLCHGTERTGRVILALPEPDTERRRWLNSGTRCQILDQGNFLGQCLPTMTRHPHGRPPSGRDESICRKFYDIWDVVWFAAHSYGFNSDGCFWSSSKYLLIVQSKTLSYSKPFRTKRPRNILRSHAYFGSPSNLKART